MNDSGNFKITPQVIVGFVTLIVIGLVYLFGIRAEEQKFQKQMSNLETDLAQARKEHVDVSNDAVSLEEYQTAAEAADETVKKLTDLETQLCEYGSKRIMDESYTSEEYKEEIAPVQEEMRKYFGERSSYASRWYMGDPRLVSYTWKSHTPYQFSGRDVPVIWTCHNNENDEMLAYVTGVYVAGSDSVVNMDNFVLPAGAEFFEVSGDTENSAYGVSAKEYGNKIMEMINNIEPVEHEVELPELEGDDLQNWRESKAAAMMQRDGVAESDGSQYASEINANNEDAPTGVTETETADSEGENSGSIDISDEEAD